VTPAGECKPDQNLGGANWVGANIRTAEGSLMQLQINHRRWARRIYGRIQALSRQFSPDRNNRLL